MSAKLANQKHPVNLPDLPVELWGSILRFATLIPDTLEDASVERYYGGGHFMRVKRYREAMVTKRRVVLVCHAWRALGTPFLYEHLYLPRLRRLDAVLQSLEIPFTSPGHQGSAVTLGHLSKRLDVTLPSDCGWEWQESGSLVLKILKRTPNLLIVRLDWQALRGILDPMTLAGTGVHGSLLHSLECIDISETFDVPVPSLASDFLAFLDRHPYLRRLDLVTIRLTNDIRQDSREPATRPAVRELDFSPAELVKMSAIFPQGTFPNLEKAVVLCHSPTIEAFSDCLHAHGKPLRAISLAYSSAMADARIHPVVPTWHRIEAVLRVLGQTCPALEELSFSGTEWVVIPSQPAEGSVSLAMPTVATLGIEIEAHKRQFSTRICIEFLESALSWTRRRHLPNLRTIMFLSESNVRHMRRSHAKRLARFIGECAAAGVQVQDNFRMPLCESLDVWSD